MSKIEYVIRNERFPLSETVADFATVEAAAGRQARDMQQCVYIYEVRLVGVMEMVPQFTPEPRDS